jgi:hypothetical protein
VRDSPCHCVQIQNGQRQPVNYPLRYLLSSWGSWGSILLSINAWDDSIGISNVLDNGVRSVLSDTDWETQDTANETERNGEKSSNATKSTTEKTSKAAEAASESTASESTSESAAFASVSYIQAQEKRSLTILVQIVEDRQLEQQRRGKEQTGR